MKCVVLFGMLKNFQPDKSQSVCIKKRKRKMPLNEDRTSFKRPLEQIPCGVSNKQKQNHALGSNSKHLYADISHKNNGLNNWSKFKDLELKTKPPLNKLITNNTVRLQKVALSKPATNSVKERHNYKSSHNRAKPYLTKCVAIDCEMVGVEENGKDDMVARVSLVNGYGECIYDKFVKPMEPVVDYRTFVSGVRPKDLENGEDFKVVQKEVADILKGKQLIGHALRNDLKVLFLTHPKWAIRDTSRYHKFREGYKNTPALKKLVEKYLGIKIQEGEHNSVEDANAAMQLYLMHRREWEEELKRKRRCYHKIVKHNPPEKLTADNV